MMMTLFGGAFRFIVYLMSLAFFGLNVGVLGIYGQSLGMRKGIS